MAESKFQALFNKQVPASAVPDRIEHTPALPASNSRPTGRPPGKRSDPAWKQYSILLRRETQREAANKLREDSALDLSSLVQQLLEAWLRDSRT